MRLVLIALSVGGCAFIREIPATSTPVRTARYYQTQDVANLAAGVAADELLRLVFKGPQQCADAGQAPRGFDSRGYSVECRLWHPVWRLGIIATAGLARRQLDRGYRESGAMFNVSGALLWEIVRCATSSGCSRSRR